MIEGHEDILLGRGSVTDDQHPTQPKVETVIIYRLNPKKGLVTFSLRKVTKYPDRNPVYKDYSPYELAVAERKKFTDELLGLEVAWSKVADSLPPPDGVAAQSPK